MSQDIIYSDDVHCKRWQRIGIRAGGVFVCVYKNSMDKKALSYCCLQNQAISFSTKNSCIYLHKKNKSLQKREIVQTIGTFYYG